VAESSGGRIVRSEDLPAVFQDRYRVHRHRDAGGATVDLVSVAAGSATVTYRGDGYDTSRLAPNRPGDCPRIARPDASALADDAGRRRLAKRERLPAPESGFGVPSARRLPARESV